MSKNGPQCKIGTRETKALAKALESSYPVNEQTILAKIESFQTAYDKDPMYVPSVPEMKAFLDSQAAQGDLVVPISQISNLRKQVEEGTATMQRLGGTIYIATKSGMVVKVLPNNTMVVTNPSDTSEEGIALHQAFDTFFSKTSEAGPEENEIKWGRFSDNGYEVSTRGDKRFSALVATFKEGTVIDGVDVSGMTIENVYQSVIKKSGKGKAPSRESKLFIDTAPKFRGKMSFAYGSQRASGVTSATTLEAIKNGERTATTRYTSDGNIDYWKQAKVGDVIEFTGQNGDKVLVRVTKELHQLPKSTTAEEWSAKEGWDTSRFEQRVRPQIEKGEAYQMEFEYIDQSKAAMEDFSYREEYLPLWKEWAKQNPELIDELRIKAKGKTLTDQFANTRVSQARALADILNSIRDKRNTNIQTISTIEIPGVELKEDTERSYLSRTRQNAEWSDITIALGEDLTTTGELQTAKLAGAEVVEEERTNARDEKYTTVTRVTNPRKGKYVGINLNTVSSAEAIATEIYNQIIERNLPTNNIKLNIAGNGIYTLKSEQASYDKLLTEVLKALQGKGITISEVRSGGQSGIDEAGIKAAVSLGLKASILAPKGYRFRGKDNKDISNKELFIKRFNPDYKEPKKVQRKKAEVLYEDEEITEAKKKAKEFTLISSTQLGANSAWKIAGENYGIEAIQMSNTETYDDLSADERASLEQPYRNACRAAKVSELSLTDAGASSYKKKAAKLSRLLYKQIKESDGVFIIAELVDPGAIPHSSSKDKESTKNRADFAKASDYNTFGGASNSVATYHALQMKKPIHVYDEFRDSWMTYDYTKGEWIKEDTPALTKRALTLGQTGNKNGRGFDETLGEKNWKAIRDVMHKTFGWRALNYVDKSSKVLTDADMNKVWRETKKESEKYSIDMSGVNIDDTNAIAKLIQAMSSNERYHRTQYLAREFSAIIDDFIEKDKQDIKDRVLAARVKVDGDTLEGAELKAWKRILAQEEKYKKILDSNDESKIRQAIIRRHGLTNIDNLTEKNFGILDELKKRIQDKIANSEDGTKRAKWQAVLDNFDPLMTDAFDVVQYIENFRLVPYTKKGSANIEAEPTTDSDILQTDEDNLVDDEGNNMEGNSGWSFKVRFVDPRQSLSQITKRALNSIEMRDEDGKRKTDDLGMPSYVNGEFAHAVLINELSDMIDSDDFCRQVENRDGIIKFEYPALEKVAVKYPWVKGLINKLRKDNQLAGAFFHDFNKAFIKYYSCDFSGKPLPLNSAIAEDSAYNALKTNYEAGITLTNSSVYSEGGFERENAKSLLNRLNLLTTQIDGVLSDKDYIDSQESKGKGKKVKEQKAALMSNLGNISKELTFILRSMGFNSDEVYMRNNLYLLLTKDAKGVMMYTKLADNIKTILTAISEGELVRGKGKKASKVGVKEDDNYLVDFQGQIKNICKLVGQVSEADNIQSFRDGNKTRYSYSAVNYAINMVKKLKSDARRANYLKEEFQYDDWFFHDGEWQNYWLEAFAGTDSDSQYLRDNLELSEVISMQTEDKKGDPIKYGDWDEYQTYRVMLGQFFSRASGEEGIQLANYNFPIFSDSPTSMYITMRRFVDSAKEGTFKDQMLPLFIKLVKQEMRRIKMVNDRDRARQDDSIADKSALEKIKCFDKNGNKFQFFPELNTLVDYETGMTFKDAAIQYAEEGNIDALDELIARTLAGTINPTSGQREGGLMDKLFMEFVQQFPLDKDSMAKMLHELGGIKYLTDYDAKQYAKDNNISEKEAKNIIESMNTQNSMHALENYFWNSVFATSQIIQLTTTDLAYYKNATDFFKRFKEVYAAGNRLNVNTKYGRRIENTIYVADHIVTASKYTLVKKSLDNAVENGRMNADERDIILGQLKNINAADAQAFRNPFAFRAVLDMMGSWSDEMDDAFNRIINNKYDAGDFTIIWQTIKPFVFTNVPTDNGLGGRMRVPHQHKNSEYLSLAFYDMIAMSTAKNMTLKNSEWLRGLGQFFNEHPEIDVVQFESAVKVGGQGIIDLSYTGDAVETYLYETDVDEEGKIVYKVDNHGNRIPSKYYNRAKEVIARQAKKEGKNPEKEFNKLDNMAKLKAGLDDMLDTGDVSQDKYNEIIKQTEPASDELYKYLNKVIADPETKKFKISNDRTGGTFNHQVVHQIKYEDYMIAQPTPPHFMDQDEATSGSQFRNLILANLPADFKTTVTIKRGSKDTTVELNREQIRNLYRGAIVNNLLDSFEQLRDGVFSDIHSLQKKLLAAVQNNPKYGTDIIDALQIITIEDPLNPGKTIETFNLPLDLPTISNQIQELLLSTFKNHITKQTINGGSFIQVANVGLTKKLHVERNEDGTIKYAECMLPAWSEKFFKYYMSEDKNGNKFLDIDKVPEDLKRMVGYRIPTENKYSMLPLRVVGFLPAEQGGSIMLPADITLIAGSDFDVDKMFLRIPAFEEVTNEDGTKSLQKIEYNLDNLIQGEEWRATSKGSMTKKQRDNMMIDIEYAILTSVEGSEQVYKPGNFDTVKKWGKVSRIIDNANLRRQFITQYGHLIGLNTEDAEEVERNDNASTILRILHHKTNENGTERDTITLRDLQDFLDNGQQMNALLPQTYNYMHTQNMVGASLVGVYANGASMHTKMQETYLSIDDEHAFSIAGYDGNFRRIQSLHDQTVEINGRVVYIQELIAQLQAASVDNAKDPTLADLYQSMLTSSIALMMTRAGIDLEELSYFFGVEKSTNKMGLEVKNKQINNLFSHVIRRFGKVDNAKHVTVEEIINTNLYVQKYPELIDAYLHTKTSEKSDDTNLNPELEAFLDDYGRKHNLTREEMDNILQTIYNTYSVFVNIKNLKNKLKPANDIMRCDSVNHALAVSIPSAILQKFEVDRVNAIMDSNDFPFIGSENPHVGDEFIMNKVITSVQSRAEMEANLMSRRLPHIQAFYSLGIELPLGMMKDFLIQGNSELQENLISLLRDAPDSVFKRTSYDNFGGTRLVNSYFREYMQYLLSATEEFGDSDKESYDVKRMYYLEKFAKDFMKLKKKALNTSSDKLTPLQKAFLYNSTLSRITITRPSGENANQVPQLILPKSGKLTPLMKASIRRDLDTLLYSKDPEIVELGINLFKYSFYNNGFNYGPNAFGSYFDSIYWNAMPRVISLLRTFKHDDASIKKSLANFTEMFIANHSDDPTDDLLLTYDSGWPMTINEDGTVTVDRAKVYSMVSKGSRKYIRIASATSSNGFIPYVLVKDSYEEKTATYKPMPVFDEPKPVYNANSTAEKMMSMYYNDRKAKIQARLDAIRAEETKNGGSSLSATDTGNTQGIDEAMAQSDAAERQSASATKAAAHINAAEVQAQDKMGSSAEAMIAKINNSDDIPSVDPKTIEDIVNAEAQFMKTTVKNIPKIKGMIDAYTSNLSNEQANKAEAIAKESKAAYDKINKCNIK